METRWQDIKLSPELIVLLVVGALLLWQNMNMATKAEITATKAEITATKAEITATKSEVKSEIAGLSASFRSFQEDHGVRLSDELYEKLHTATFAILDKQGHPICCGFFVKPCGVALTAAHCVPLTARKQSKNSVFVRAVNYRGTEFDLDVVVKKIGELDIAVLRLPSRPGIPVERLDLPALGSLQPSQLREAPVHLVHGNIAWCDKQAAQLGQDRGHVVAVNDTLVHYNVSSMGGHSGAALILRGHQLIALHAEGVNDVAEEYSHSSPSTHANAIRLDLAPIHAAVQKHVR